MGQLTLAFGQDELILTGQSSFGGDIANGAVQPNVIIVPYKPIHNPPGILQGERGLGADGLAFEGFVPAFQLAVTLGIVG